MMLITLSEARAQLGLEDGEDEESNERIESYIRGVALTWDNRHGIVIDRQERSFLFDRFESLMVLPALPVDVETIEIVYLDAAGNEQPVTEFRTAPFGKRIRLLPAIGKCWPRPACGAGVITVTATVGWQADADASDAVPEDMKIAARMMVAHLDNNREAAGSKLDEVPLGVATMLDPYLRRGV